MQDFYLSWSIIRQVCQYFYWRKGSVELHSPPLSTCCWGWWSEGFSVIWVNWTFKAFSSVDGFVWSCLVPSAGPPSSLHTHCAVIYVIPSATCCIDRFGQIKSFTASIGCSGIKISLQIISKLHDKINYWIFECGLVGPCWHIMQHSADTNCERLFNVNVSVNCW